MQFLKKSKIVLVLALGETNRNIQGVFVYLIEAVTIVMMISIEIDLFSFFGY